MLLIGGRCPSLGDQLVCQRAILGDTTAYKRLRASNGLLRRQDTHLIILKVEDHFITNSYAEGTRYAAGSTMRPPSATRVRTSGNVTPA